MKRIFFIICCTLCCLLSATQVEAKKKHMTITAHTGAYETPDNTMEFLDVALPKNPDIVEIDIRSRPDGTIIMSHDDVRSNSEGVEVYKALEKIKKTKIRINLDIKQDRVIKGLYALIRQYKMEKQVFMTGVEEERTSVARRDAPGIKYYLNCSPDTEKIEDADYQKELLAILKRTGSIGVNCSYEHATKTLSDLLHKNGYFLSVWTVNHAEDVMRMLQFDVDNITSRKPDVVLKAVDSFRKTKK